MMVFSSVQRLARMVIGSVASIFPRPIRRPIYLMLGIWGTYAMLWMIYFLLSNVIPEATMFLEILQLILITMKNFFLLGYTIARNFLGLNELLAWIVYFVLLFGISYLLSVGLGVNSRTIRGLVILGLIGLYIYLYYLQ
ncbi:hypothetical protein [Culicoidibacter larvae]|uniref:Uncharacterized protein n=1 Tax=Culicoidibacter larvae TaxID=2579976 RepID=A0A5R8Q898_9FIRM|nr:hypothetical protein [Culicoidibacter larvae]TLG71287.1 hypothetical protein FEZ08_11090 [Culicoidibacter larvae]